MLRARDFSSSHALRANIIEPDYGFHPVAINLINLCAQEMSDYSKLSGMKIDETN